MSQTLLEARTPSAPSSATVHDLVGRLQELVRQNRRRWKVVMLLEAVGLAVSLPLAYLWLVFYLDTQFYLPLLGRCAASLGLLVGVIWAGRHLWGRWRQLKLGEDEVALAIEQRTPGKVQNRLINAVQLARLEKHDLSEAVIEENYERLQQIHLEQAAQLRPALIRVGIAAALILLGIGYWLREPALFGNTASRIFMPLASIDPLYRTRLTVEPGDMEFNGEAVISVAIQGERPKSLTILRKGKLTPETVEVPQGDGDVVYRFQQVTQTFLYRVRGGDFTTRYYQVTVPQAVTLSRVRVVYQYPGYTGLAAKTAETTSADLEALQGTKAEATFVFNQEMERATLVLEQRGKAAPVALRKVDDGRAWAGEVSFDESAAYRLEVQQGERPVVRMGPFAVRVVKDQEPKLELQGLERQGETAVDAVLPLQMVASDDFGLEKVGLFFRRLTSQGDKAQQREEDWQLIQEWAGNGATAWKDKHELLIAKLDMVEGEKVELAARAIDTAPTRRGQWITGAIYELTVGGEGVALQLQYEQILRGEKELKALIDSEQALQGKLVEWLIKLDGAGDLRWDDPKNIEALHVAVKSLLEQHKALQLRTGAVAKAMPAMTGNLRIAVGMLADTEMVRLQRILDSVISRDQPATKRSALADARVTQERVTRSLQDLHEQYVAFRSDWELGNMIPFTKMLADRQATMRDQSKKHLAPIAASVEVHARTSMSRRQQKVQEWCGLIRPAFAGMAERVQDPEPSLAKAFMDAGAMLGSEALLAPMREAAAKAKAGAWQAAVDSQGAAADQLLSLHGRLRKAQVEAAQKALAALKEKAKSNLEAQQELEKLAAGSADAFVKEFPNEFKVEDMVRIWEVNGKKRKDGDDAEQNFKDAPLVDVDKAAIELSKDSGVRQDTDTLKLGTEAGKTAVLKLPKDKEKNSVKPFIQEKFDDLVGKLLDEADELNKDYQTLNLSTNQNNNDPGEIGKNGGALNSTGAVAATGNKKPPTTEAGGVSRTGRQGARAYGMVADEEVFNRKGRDKALEGQEQIADQAGKNKMHKTDENQTDTSTGVGGKKIESDDTHFSLKDAGKWKDEYIKRMEKPQKKEYIVERQGDKFDAKMAAQLRDLTSKQEQVIERLKAIKKELKNLYLPTEHLDELAASLESNLESLKDRPDAEMFRLQLQTLDRLRGALRVFQSANASFQPSLPRERLIRGRVLDEPNRPAIPGYEEAVRQYYLKLAIQ